LVDWAPIIRILAAGIILGVVVGKFVAERPYHLKRILPSHWFKVARRMNKNQWVRLVAVALLVTVACLLVTYFVAGMFVRAGVKLEEPAENPLRILQQEFPWALLILVNILPIFEEWVFRGVMMDEIIRQKGSALLAVILSSVVFAAFHLSNPGTYPAFALTLFPSSLLLGICYLKVGLGGAVLAHNSYNSFLVIVGML
jgi:membrane protease YdiL (CAAX protease family)